MPSMTSERAAAFDQAFRPTEDQVDRLAQLMETITRLDLGPGYCSSCSMTDNGETLMVSSHYCAHCNRIHGHEHDGEADCIHKQALAAAIEDLERERMQDWADERDYAHSVTVGAG